MLPRLKVISQKVFIKSFGKSQFTHRSVNLSFSITNLKNKLTDLCGNRLLRNNFITTFCGIREVLDEEVVRLDLTENIH